MPQIPAISSLREGLSAAFHGASASGLAWVAQLDLVRVLRRGWRYPAIAAALALTMAGLYLAGQKRMYQATARLLVLQQGGPPLSAGDSGRMLGGDDYLPTHAAILKSPLVVGRAIEAVGIANLPTLAAAHNRSGPSAGPTAPPRSSASTTAPGLARRRPGWSPPWWRATRASSRTSSRRATATSSR